ncbi:hypothetical protein [uncultured Helicobacter sp.]|uniref:hypothetical protein n=1 Tax=uncultured Helicobacter sp. TaxID=175537 RepID=UPI0026105880|nr:hypothetical protein [uncultured Helicobacter sp.]
MSYSYSKQFGVQSYMSGVNYSDWMKEALNPENKSAENERLSITSSQEDYFKKQRLIQEAIAQLQSRGSVSSEIAKEIDVESLKKSLKDAENGESNALNIGEGSESSEARKQSQLNAKAQSATLKTAVNVLDKEQNITPNVLQQATNVAEDEEIQKTKDIIKQSIDNDSLANRMADRTSGLFNKPVFSTSPIVPSNVSEQDKTAYNPLAIQADSTTESVQGILAVEFTDEVSGTNVRVPLTQENADKLKEQFGSLEMASDYVKGFYYDAAYKMGYLSSDSDGDGKISLDEGVNLKTLVSLMSGEYSSVSEQFGGNVEMQKKFLEQVGFIDNLADFINHSISQDGNFDGSLSLNEILNGTNEAVFLKTAQNANSSSVEVLVIQSFKIEFNQEELNDTLLNLGAKAEDSAQILNNRKLKELLDVSYLESLDEVTREQLFKSEVLLKNMLESV